MASASDSDFRSCMKRVFVRNPQSGAVRSLVMVSGGPPCTMPSPVPTSCSRSLIGSDGEQRVVVDSFDEAVSQCVQHGTEGANVFGIGHLLVGFRTDGAVVDDGATCDRAAAVIDRNGWVDEIAVRVEMAGADFGDLAWT